MPDQRHLVDDTGHVVVPLFDVEGYLESVERCRHQFPELRVHTGVEFGQPHLRERQARQLLDLDALGRVIGSLHTLPWDGGRTEPNTLYRLWAPGDVMTAYLEEVTRMAASDATFDVVTHLDYAVRTWPAEQVGPFDPHRFEEPFRLAMRAIAGSGRALEMKTRRLWSWMPQWWAEEGGRAVTFGSDAHVPELLAAHFPEAVAMVEHYGFARGGRPEDPWTR